MTALKVAPKGKNSYGENSIVPKTCTKSALMSSWE